MFNENTTMAQLFYIVISAAAAVHDGAERGESGERRGGGEGRGAEKADLLRENGGQTHFKIPLSMLQN